MRWLLLGAKEYPFGAGSRDDPLPSGGYEKYAEQLAEALADAGHDVHVVTRRFKKPARALKRNPRIHVHAVRWLSGRLLRNPSFNAAALFKASRLEFDVILTQGVMATLAALALKKIKNRPLIALPAGVAYSQPQHGHWLARIIRELETTAYGHADAVVFLSEQEREQFKNKLGFLPKWTDIIPPGVAIQKQDNGKKKKRPALQKAKTGKPLRLLFVGRLIEVKGLQFLIPAMTGLDAELTIVGSGPQEHALKEQARRLGLKNVHFAGYHADPSAYYQNADAFVLPSLSEGLPLSALEAAANGLALIVTDIGLPFEHAKTAVVVPPSDSKALHAAIAKLAKEKTMRQRLGQDARAFVAKTYSWKKTAAALDVLAARL
ncbi:glycosyltransferase family 4 protein [Candidatus Micrarchaeota archaeon]|nr:glycosyltransferase family 4 protein [Candidatus Micrarchaeota archaeon]